MFNSIGVFDEDCRWFLKWLTLRARIKKIELENGQLKSEVQHLEFIIKKQKDKELNQLKQKFNKIEIAKRKEERKNGKKTL